MAWNRLTQAEVVLQSKSAVVGIVNIKGHEETTKMFAPLLSKQQQKQQYSSGMPFIIQIIALKQYVAEYIPCK